MALTHDPLHRTEPNHSILRTLRTACLLWTCVAATRGDAKQQGAHDMQVQAPLFRPGSGASVPVTGYPKVSTDPVSTEFGATPLLTSDRATVAAAIALALCSCSAVAMMFRGSRDNHGGNHSTHHSSGHHRSVPPQHLGKVPPAYDPRFEHRYSFRQYMKDMQHWVLYTDLQPHQQAVAILHNLEGAAHDLISQLSPAELYAGATVNGRQLDPVSHILMLLHHRFAQQDLVTRMSAMSEMLNFRRLHNEAIGSTLTRFEVVRGRAASEGQFVMNLEGYSVMLMKECRLSRQHIHNLLLPYGGDFPKTEDEFQMLMDGIKKIGLLHDDGPNTIGQLLSGRSNHHSFPIDASEEPKRSGSR